ncbi:thymidine kinase, cytosolic [Sinocyclocheilus anshuiensis]|uniref:thymidine kinase, cytosolic n=1 Tax=Sinocyclocheilus anshuiensis TaxID=1608454 RepID=UPI0007B9E2A4|nr:PREDICTED: thymidine kinase, cytosolic-like [Sinocyclocheilus anshuiensis]
MIFSAALETFECERERECVCVCVRERERESVCYVSLSEGLVCLCCRSTMEAVPASCLRDVWTLALQACVIGIDEGQFFPDTVEFCEEMANMGKTIVVAALDGTFQRKAFGNILNLVPLAESVVKLNAVCMQCFKEAAYTKRLGAEQEVEVIGGADKYHAVCRECYGGLVACKENCDPQREETPPHVMSGKQPNQSAPRKLFASLHL